MEKIKPIKLKKEMTVKELVEQMKDAGFGARKIGKAREIVQEMFNDKECKVFFGLAGAMVPAGMKHVIIDLIKDGKIDVLVSTGANLTHDLIEALGEEHYHCDEWDDEEFHKKGYVRMYNVLMKNKVYVILEKFFEENWEELSTCKTIKDFLRKIGEILSRNSLTHPLKIIQAKNSQNNFDDKLSNNNPRNNEGIEIMERNENQSILRACYEKNVQLYCPGLADSGMGLMIWGRKATGKKDIFIDAFDTENQGFSVSKIPERAYARTLVDGIFDEMKEIIDFAWTSKKTGVIYVGGGMPKNFIQQSLQFSKGADYGVQITVEPAEPGGSSGAGLEEGKSWGKLKKDADFADVRCDATIALPLIFS